MCLTFQQSRRVNELIQAEYATTTDVAALAQRAGVSSRVLWRRAHRLGVMRIHPLSEDDLQLILKLVGDGVPVAEAAEKFEVGAAWLARIIRQRWH